MWNFTFFGVIQVNGKVTNHPLFLDRARFVLGNCGAVEVRLLSTDKNANDRKKKSRN